MSEATVAELLSYSLEMQVSMARLARECGLHFLGYTCEVAAQEARRLLDEDAAPDRKPRLPHGPH